jgi:hypothetical protein
MASELRDEFYSGFGEEEVEQLHGLLTRLRDRLVDMKIGSAE